jgi:hypothetical protein
MGRAYLIHDIAWAFSEASLQGRDREATVAAIDQAGHRELFFSGASGNCNGL